MDNILPTDAYELYNSPDIGELYIYNNNEYISNMIKLKGLYERPVLECTREIAVKGEGMIAIDVGANLGNHTLFYLTFLKRVIAFEPNDFNFQMLLKTIKHQKLEDRVDVNDIMCSDFRGKRTMTMFTWNQKNDIWNSGAMKEGELKGLPTMEVKVWPIDEVFDRELIKDCISVFKVDVDGEDFEVIKGAEQTLLANPQCVIQFEITNKQPDGWKEEVVKWFNERGWFQLKSFAGYHSLFVPKSIAEANHKELMI